MPTNALEIAAKSHWNRVYNSRPADAVSWFQEHADQSLRLIADAGAAPTAAVIDVGGGASTLVDDLLRQGFGHLSVLDLSAAALSVAQACLGARPMSMPCCALSNRLAMSSWPSMLRMARFSAVQCSRLTVARYDAQDFHAQFGAPFTLLRHEKEVHRTPAGAVQKFVNCYCRKEAT